VRRKFPINQGAIPRTSYTSGPSLKIKIIVIRSLFSVRCPETFLVQSILPTCISNRASIVLYCAFAIINFSMESCCFHSAVCFSIATHESFQNSLSGLAEMARGFLYQKNITKAYSCYNIKY